ncbi:hypothetical protein RHMOL_Rhmol11G0060800 [Rhododendron molle]|uniref:Uncharacterized protein n=1 Tax=Rhododendron molle TaxID=49168 RepID=A0ACC0LQC4_RHOML|nr:hypothetical protein RHMOL_Rhmol11G0060800 [Rhododendron molle]
MTITPGDFALLIGLRVGGNPLPIDPRIHEQEGAFDYLLGKTLDVTKSGHVTYSWLWAQYDQEEFDWGTPALATLYRHLNACSRGVSLSLGGHHRVFELWAFEHLLQFPPQRTRSPAMDLLALRRVLDHLTVDRVRFDPWDTLLDDAPLELTSARALDSQHFLIEGPFSRAWYLGERMASMYFQRLEAL